MELTPDVHRRLRSASSLQKPNPRRTSLSLNHVTTNTSQEHVTKQHISSVMPQQPVTSNGLDTRHTGTWHQPATESSITSQTTRLKSRRIHLEKPRPKRMKSEATSRIAVEAIDSVSIFQPESVSRTIPAPQSTPSSPQYIDHISSQTISPPQPTPPPPQYIDHHISSQTISPPQPTPPPPQYIDHISSQMISSQTSCPRPQYIDHISSPPNQLQSQLRESPEPTVFTRPLLLSQKSVDSGLGDMTFSPRTSPLFNVSQSPGQCEEEWMEMDESEKVSFKFCPAVLDKVTEEPPNRLRSRRTLHTQTYKPQTASQPPCAFSTSDSWGRYDTTKNSPVADRSFGQHVGRQVVFGANVTPTFTQHCAAGEPVNDNKFNIMVTVPSKPSTDVFRSSLSNTINHQKNVVLNETASRSHNCFSVDRQNGRLDAGRPKSVQSGRHTHDTVVKDCKWSARKEGRMGGNWAQGFIKSVLHENKKIDLRNSNSPSPKPFRGMQTPAQVLPKVVRTEVQAVDENSRRATCKKQLTMAEVKAFSAVDKRQGDTRLLQKSMNRLTPLSRISRELIASSPTEDWDSDIQEQNISPVRNFKISLVSDDNRHVSRNRNIDQLSPVYTVEAQSNLFDPETTPKAGSRLAGFRNNWSENDQYSKTLDVNMTHSAENGLKDATNINKGVDARGTSLFENFSNCMQYRSQRQDCDLRSVSDSTTDCDEISSVSTCEPTDHPSSDFLDELTREVEHLSFHERCVSREGMLPGPGQVNDEHCVSRGGMVPGLGQVNDERCVSRGGMVPGPAQVNDGWLYPADIDQIEAELDFVEDDIVYDKEEPLLPESVLTVIRQPISPSTNLDVIRKIEKSMPCSFSSSKSRRTLFRNIKILSEDVSEFPSRSRHLSYTADELLKLGDSELSKQAPGMWFVMVEMYPEICLHHVDKFFNAALYAEQRQYMTENWIVRPQEKKLGNNRIMRTVRVEQVMAPIGDNSIGQKWSSMAPVKWPGTELTGRVGFRSALWGPPPTFQGTQRSLPQQSMTGKMFEGQVAGNINIDSKCDVSIRRDMSGTHVVDRTKCPW